jgi:site-specific recombinase XerD
MNAVVTMQTRVEDYLAERRRLGYHLRSTALALRSFARYVDGLDLSTPLNIDVMAVWARQAKTNSDNPTTWARRLKRLRPFTRWLQQFNPGTEVPDSTVFGPIGWRPAPHIFAEQEIGDLLAAARRLKPDLRGATYEALFGALAATGMRVSEAVHLRQTDVDLHTGLLTVRQTKFDKSRYVPLHPSTTEALRRYQGLRSLYISAKEDTPFFVGTRGRRLGCELSLRQVDRIFQRLREQLGWVNRGSHAAIRVHDLRHSFIVSRLVRWHAQGVDIDQAMLALSTYVGHARVTNTYWYLSGVPELMGLAAERFASPVQDTEVNHV